MPKVTPPINSFNAGEISPWLDFRSDIQKYNSACRTLQNAFPLTEGGAKKMPGSFFAAKAKNSESKCRLVPFSFSTTQDYILEFGQQYIRVYANGGQVVVSNQIEGAMVYDGANGYTAGIIVSVGNFWQFAFSAGNLYISVPYGLTNGGAGVAIQFGVNSTDNLVVQTVGSGYYETIQILLANTTASKNTAELIEAGLAALSRPTGIADPTVQPTCSNTLGGSLAAKVYTVAITWLNTTGETMASPYKYVVRPANDLLTVTPPTAPIGAIAWNCYVDIAAGVNLTLQNSSPLTLGAPYTEPGTGFTNTGAAEPSQNTTGYSLNTELVNGYDTAQWVVTADAAYAASPATSLPTSQNPAYINDNLLGNYWECLQTTGSVGHPGNTFPPASPTYWSSTLSGSPSYVPVEIATPYQEADLFNLDCSAQSGDILYIFHNQYPPMMLERHSHENWSLLPLGTASSAGAINGCMGTPDIFNTGFNRIGTVIDDIPVRANPTVIHAKGHGLKTGDVVYISGIVGMVELNQERYIVSVGSPDIFSIPVDSTNFAAYEGYGTVVKLVQLFNTPGNYPSCGTFFEQRLCVAGSLNNPVRINCSCSGDYYNFTNDPNEDDSAVQFTLVSAKIDPIRWMVGKDKIVIGTSGAVWVFGGANNGPLSPTSVDASVQVSIGVNQIEPQIVNDTFVWVTRYGGIIRLLQYAWAENRWIDPDLTRLARHITQAVTRAGSGIIQTAFQAEPVPILWAVRNDGVLLGMTFESQEQVYAWFRVVTNGFVESVAVISQDNAEDQVWISVLRGSS